MVWREEGREKDLRYMIITYALFVFAIGLVPYFIFLLFIYVLQDKELNVILSKNNLREYLLIIIMFIAQNLLFIIYPSLIFDFVNL